MALCVLTECPTNSLDDFIKQGDTAEPPPPPQDGEEGVQLSNAIAVSSKLPVDIHQSRAGPFSQLLALEAA